MTDSRSSATRWKQRFARVLEPPSFARWAAPYRTLRHVLGWSFGRVHLNDARNILVIRPDEIGDVVLTGPFLRELRRAAPRAHIALLVKTACRELVEHCPYVDAVHALNFCTGGIGYHLRLRWAAWCLRWSRLPWLGFDLVLLPRRDADWYDSEFVGHLLAGHGALLVHRDKAVKNSPQMPLDQPMAFESFSNPHIEHEVLHNLRFLGWCGAADVTSSHLELWFTSADRNIARDWLTQHLPRRAPLVVLHPSGGRSRLKQWPIENFHAVLNLLLAETSCDFLIFGGEEEGWIAMEFSCVAGERVAVAVGQFTLRQLSAVFEEATLFLGGDSGPMHLAAAAGVPVIAVFGSTSEVRFSPWDSHCKVVSKHYDCSPDVLRTYENRCQSCRFPEPRCLTELSVESVVVEVREALYSGQSETGYQMVK